MKIKPILLYFLENEDTKEDKLFDTPLFKFPINDHSLIIMTPKNGFDFEMLFLYDAKEKTIPLLFNSWNEYDRLFELKEKEKILTVREVKEKVNEIIPNEFQEMIQNIDLDEFDYLIDLHQEEWDQEVEQSVQSLEIPDVSELTRILISEANLRLAGESISSIIHALEDPYEFAYHLISTYMKDHKDFMEECVHLVYIQSQVQKQINETPKEELMYARDRLTSIFQDPSRKSVQVTFLNGNGSEIRQSKWCKKETLVNLPFFCILKIEYKKHVIYEESLSNIQAWTNNPDLWIEHFSPESFIVKYAKVSHFHAFHADCFRLIPESCIKDISFLAKLFSYKIWFSQLKNLFPPFTDADRQTEFLKQLKDFITPKNKDQIYWQIQDLLKDSSLQITNTDHIKLFSEIGIVVTSYIKPPYILDKKMIDCIFESSAIDEGTPVRDCQPLQFSLQQFNRNPYLVERFERFVIEHLDQKNLWNIYPWAYSVSGLMSENFSKEDQEGLNTICEYATHPDFAIVLDAMTHQLLEFKRIPMSDEFLIQFLKECYVMDMEGLRKIPKSRWTHPELLWALYVAASAHRSSPLFDFMMECKQEAINSGLNFSEFVREQYKKNPEMRVLKQGTLSDIQLILEEDPSLIKHHERFTQEPFGSQKEIFEFLSRHEAEFEFFKESGKLTDPLACCFMNFTDDTINFIEKHPVYWYYLDPCNQGNYALIEKIYDKIPLTSLVQYASSVDKDEFFENEDLFLKQASMKKYNVLTLFESRFFYKELENPSNHFLYSDSEFLLKLLKIDQNILDHLRKSHPCWKDENFAKEAVKYNSALKDRFSKQIQKDLN